MGLFSLVYQAGTTLEISKQDAEMFMDEFGELIKDIDGPGIFLHNIMLALPMFLPGFGAAWGMFSAASTGYAFAAIALLTPELRQIHPLTIIYLTPFGVMEIVAYSIATSRSYMLIWAMIKKTDLRTHVKPTILEMGLVVGLLLAGGFLEYYMIELAMEESILPGL